MKIATHVDVFNIAKTFCKVNGSVTTLDIKNSLRGQKFWINQDEISSMMENLWSNDIFARRHNGSWWVYTLVSNTDDLMATWKRSQGMVSDDELDAHPTFQDSGDDILLSDLFDKNKQLKATVVVSVGNVGDWLAYCDPPLLEAKTYPSDLTRSQVRVRFANEIGIRYNDARAKRIR